MQAGLRFFEIALVLVRFDHVASVIVNTNHSIAATRSSARIAPFADGKSATKTNYEKVMINLLTELGLRSESPQKNGGVKMKIRGLVLIMVAVALNFAPQFVNTSSAAGGYSSRLISPTLGQVLYHGQQFRIEWAPTFPHMHLNGSEMEIWLSLDGGKTFTTWVAFTGVTNTYYDWTVPNTPTNAAVLDIRFGREMPYYPETFSPQPASTFVIQ